jgi:hypothetical protein
VSPTLDFRLDLNASFENKASSTGNVTAVALLTEPAGEGDAEGEGLPAAFELEFPPGSVAQPTAKINRPSISPKAVDFIAFILEYLVIDVCRHDVAFRSYPSPFAYFVLAVLALGEGDATGEGLAAGLGLFRGALSVARLGEVDADGEGLATAGEFELLAGSQPAADMIENVVRSASAVRLIRLMFAVVIVFSSFQQD